MAKKNNNPVEPTAAPSAQPAAPGVSADEASRIAEQAAGIQRGSGRKTRGASGTGVTERRRRSAETSVRQKKRKGRKQATVRQEVAERVAAQENYKRLTKALATARRIEVANGQHDRAIIRAGFQVHRDDEGNTHIIDPQHPEVPLHTIPHHSALGDGTIDTGISVAKDLTESIDDYSNAIGQIQEHFRKNYSVDSKRGLVNEPANGKTSYPLEIPAKHITTFIKGIAQTDPYAKNNIQRYSNKKGYVPLTLATMTQGFRGLLEQHLSSKQMISITGANGEPISVPKTKDVIFRGMPATDEDGSKVYKPCQNPTCESSKVRRAGRATEFSTNPKCDNCGTDREVVRQGLGFDLKPSTVGEVPKFKRNTLDWDFARSTEDLSTQRSLGKAGSFSDILDSLAHYSHGILRQQETGGRRGGRRSNSSPATSGLVAAAAAAADSVTPPPGVPTKEKPMGHDFNNNGRHLKEDKCRQCQRNAHAARVEEIRQESAARLRANLGGRSGASAGPVTAGQAETNVPELRERLKGNLTKANIRRPLSDIDTTITPPKLEDTQEPKA